MDSVGPPGVPDLPQGDPPQGDLPRSRSGPQPDLRRAFFDAEKLLALNFQPLMSLQDVQPKVDDEKCMMRLVAIVNHFAMVNRHVLGDVGGLEVFAAVIGLTSSAKDVIAAQLLDKPELAVSGENMTTAASEFMTVLERTDGGKTDSFQLHFRGREVYQGESGVEVHEAREKIMDEVRGGKNHHTSDHLSVLVQSAESVWPAFVLNTIGMMPRATAGEDTVYRDINRLLNDEAGKDGGILIVCHDVQRPVDATAAYLDLDVVKAYRQDPKRSKFHIIVARTKADLYEVIDFQKCHSFADVFLKIFGQFQERLPEADLFLVTGWRAADPSDLQGCREKFERTLEDVKQRILRERPEEASSPWLARLEATLGTDQLVRRYHAVVSRKGQELLAAAGDCVRTGLQALQRRVHGLHERRVALEANSLAGVIPEVCVLVEKFAAMMRLNSLERPSASPFDFEGILTEASKHFQTLSEEFSLLNRRYGSFLTGACGGVQESVLGIFDQCGLGMNAERHHSWWARVARLKSNARTFADMYKMPLLTREQINAFTKTSALRSSSDVEHVLFVHVLDRVKSIFQRELLPLFSRWIAHFLHESYLLAFDIVLRSEAFAALRGNAAFERAFRSVLEELYNDHVCDLLQRHAQTRQPAFLERVCIERDRRESLHASEQTVLRWRRRCEEVNDPRFTDFLQRLWPPGPTNGEAASAAAAPAAKRQERVANQEPAPAAAESFPSENTSQIYSPKLFLKLDADESSFLNELGSFFFSELLVECILFYFRETETTLDFAYAENRWDRDGAFLFKHLYYRTKVDAEKAKPGLLESHERNLLGVAPSARYQGQDIKQLIREGLLQFKPTGEAVCPACGNPLSQPYCGQTGEQHQQSSTPSSKATDPFVGIVEPSAKMPDLTYGLPAAALPGYRAGLTDDVVRHAKVFLSEFYDDRADRIRAIEQEAGKYAEKYGELHSLQHVFADLEQALGQR